MNTLKITLFEYCRRGESIPLIHNGHLSEERIIEICRAHGAASIIQNGDTWAATIRDTWDTIRVKYLTLGVELSGHSVIIPPERDSKTGEINVLPFTNQRIQNH